MFSVGPVWQLHEKSGQEARLDWVKNSINYEFNDFYEYKLGLQKTTNQIKSIPEDELITIWIAENSHEQTGLRYVLYLLKERNNDMIIINTTKTYAEYFSRSDIKYVVLHTGEISPENLQIIYEQSKQEQPNPYTKERSLNKNGSLFQIMRKHCGSGKMERYIVFPKTIMTNI
jgi:Domain of unknown function (DUF1835)